MAKYHYPFNQKSSNSAETWTENKEINVELVERVGFVPLSKRLQNIDNASSLLASYRRAIFGDDDLELDESGNIIGNDDREDSFEDFDPTLDSEFTRVDSCHIDQYLDNKKKQFKKAVKVSKKVDTKKVEKPNKEDKTDE